MANQQLFVNNADTTLSVPAGTIDTTLTVADGAVFPTPVTAAGEYFLATIESGGTVEIVRVTARTGNVLTVTRAREGTLASTFPAGAKVQGRITAESLSRLIPEENFYPTVATTDLLPRASTSKAIAYIAGQDNGGNSNIFLKSSSVLWTPTNYSRIYSGASNTAITTTSINIGQALDTVTAGKYLIQFTTGNNVGTVRAITAYSAPNIQWSTALPNAVSTADGYVIYQSNFSLITESASGSLALYALIDDQDFTGTPTVPLPASGDDSNQITNTAWVRDRIAEIPTPTAAAIDDIFWENAQNVTVNRTIPAGRNAASAGPITINNGITVTISSGSTWVIV